LIALSGAATAENQYLVRVPANVNLSAATPEAPAEPISVVLSPEALPAAMVNEPYSFNLADRLSITGGTGSYNLGDVAWSLKAGDALPPGLALENGTIAGTPTVKNEAGTSFEVTGTYQDASGKQVYTIVVDGQVLKVTQIVTGIKHTCAVTLSGGAKCWGLNNDGQLGDGSTAQRLTPVNVSGLTSGVASLTAGGYHTCAVTSGGAVKCWGRNASGQLGDGTAAQRLTPVDVSGLTSGVASLTAGEVHTCAVTTSGGAKCWGSNGTRALGDNSSTNRLTPVDVSGLTSGVASLTAGSNHTCAVTTSGGAKCWGYNEYGRLGDGSTTTRGAPVDVSGLTSGVASMTAGYGHTCALTATGGVKCWGNNSLGQLGDGSTTTRWTPVDVSGLTSGVAKIEAGNYHACAVTTAGGAQCWGVNNYGVLGDGSATSRLTPVNVNGLTSGVDSLTAGEYHTCAITTSGGAKCWGYNFSGQLGDGTSTNRATPVDVLP
ncbi:MAG TPA: putative Ig domain-containing protein, partial [Saprospiraceae bacterium]|nr:putative Ig domain-containing protein [Saprospiraceae bacterium]